MAQAFENAVLIVDDNPMNIDLLVEILGMDYRLHAATSADTALKILARESVDLILLDIMMPEMDGYALCRRLQKDPETRSIPVIFITAMDQAVDEARGFKAGCVDYITKPVNPTVVQARVRTHLNLKRARQTLEYQNRELVKAARLKEEMERVTRHDLKNPLTGVFSGVELMESLDQVTEEQQECLTIIKESAHKVLRLINFSLDLFKMEQKIYRLRPEDVDVLETVRFIEREFSSLIQIRKSGLEIRVDQDPAPVGGRFLLKGEPLLFYSMLSNLIKNALEASPPGEPVSIDLDRILDGVRIRIHNQGEVPREIRANFFDKYATWGKADGTGLGTYSARLIVKTLKGEIAMTSSGEEGTCITITLGRHPA